MYLAVVQTYSVPLHKVSIIEEDMVSTCRTPLYSGEEGGGVVLNHWSICIVEETVEGEL